MQVKESKNPRTESCGTPKSKWAKAGIVNKSNNVDKGKETRLQELMNKTCEVTRDVKQC